MSRRRDHADRLTSGASLLEVLIVMGLLSLLLQLLWPAVQASRESARRMVCMTRLRDLGSAMSQHHDVYGHYPSGGWHFDWTGVPERGTGMSQPGSWIFNLLDFVGQAELRRAELSLSDQARFDAIRRRTIVPLTAFHCPSRRAAEAYPHRWNRNPYTIGGRVSPPLDWGAKTDYAANVGDHPVCEFDPGWASPASLAMGDARSFDWPTSSVSGVVFGRSRIRRGQIHDGLAKTYLVAEKYLDSRHYRTGEDFGDNENLYAGFNNDVCRSAYDPPRRDLAGVSFTTRFGSAHPSTWQAVFCDGSVRRLSYELSPKLHRSMANRSNNSLTGQAGLPSERPSPERPLAEVAGTPCRPPK